MEEPIYPVVMLVQTRSCKQKAGLIGSWPHCILVKNARFLRPRLTVLVLLGSQ